MSVFEQRGQLLVAALRQQPEFAVFSKVPVRVGDFEDPFAAAPEGVTLGRAAFAVPQLLGFHLRQALEMTWLVRHGLGQARARLAAARVGAQFLMADMASLPADRRGHVPGWLAPMAREVAPEPAVLRRLADSLAPQASADDIAAVRDAWPLLGTAEALMETGGDIRLQTDPMTALNGYGSSHRPRPWAVTFASSTASSSSERGYAGADRQRLRTTLAVLAGRKRAAVRQSLQAVRAGIARYFGLPAETAIILAASGTDTELLGLALGHLAPGEAPILNILIAPEETGRGVPMAARGRHFAVDTALGHDVNFEEPIAGFRPDTRLATVPLRDASGATRCLDVVEAEIAALVAGGIAAGQRVILHGLDLSKTGLLAPRMDFLGRLRAAHGDRFDIVIDACQTRLSGGSVRAYLGLGAVVLITGSKFFTGPPFAGAALVPEALAARLAGGWLPAGLAAYFGRDEFPRDCPAAQRLPPVGNYGLALRWHAALAEMRALARVKPERRAMIIGAFGAVARREIAGNPALAALPQPCIARGGWDEVWERLPSIFGFSLAAPHAPERMLSPAEARAVYKWLNADLSSCLPGAGEVARRICHIGQPVTLPQPGVAEGQGVLRISAGARLISGEPSHKGLNGQSRLQRELDDVAMVFKKIDLILRNWQLLATANPAPRFRPDVVASARPHEIVIDQPAGKF